MREYELYVPLHHNDGSPVAPEKLRRLRADLVDHFGGLTLFPQENEGLWRVGSTTFRDRIVILRVLTDDIPASEKILAAIRDEVQRDWQQKSFLIIARDVTAV